MKKIGLFQKSKLDVQMSWEEYKLEIRIELNIILINMLS